MEKIKGGFPPIIYCPEKIDLDGKKVNTRIRTMSSNINKKINIRQILKDNTRKPLININEDNDMDLEIINTY
jgi:hypothetical protein